MLEYVNDFFQCLETVGHDRFGVENPRKKVDLLCANLLPYQLRDAMMSCIEYVPILKKDEKILVGSYVVKQNHAKSIQKAK